MTETLSIDWKSVIYRGIESETLDYKAAQNWLKLNRTSRAKFARHCMAMANTKGGYVVVGVGEDSAGKPSLYTGLTKQQLRSFDPSSVGNFINRYADPAIDFDIEKPEVDGKSFVVFVIRRFSQLPHVSAYGLESELQQGAFYIRTADACSRPAYRSSEIHGIIQRALRNQRELLGKMIRGVLYETKQYLETDVVSLFKEQIETSRVNWKKLLNNDESEDIIVTEFSAFPSQYDPEKYSISEIRSSVESSIHTFSIPPMILLGNSEETYSTNVSIKTMIKKERLYWQAFKTGLFHYIKQLKGNEVSYEDVIRLVAEGLYFIGQLYSELGYYDELLSLNFRLRNVENKTLVTPVECNKIKKKLYKCKIPDVKVRIQRSVADLVSDPTEHSIRLIKEIFERFNFTDHNQLNLENNVANLLEKRV